MAGFDQRDGSAPRSRPGHLRYGPPKSSGGQATSNLAIAAIREHLAAKGLGLRNDSQDRSSIVGRWLFGISFGYEDPGAKASSARVERARIDDVVRFHR